MPKRSPESINLGFDELPPLPVLHRESRAYSPITFTNTRFGLRPSNSP